MDLKNQAFARQSAFDHRKKLRIVLRQLTAGQLTDDQRSQALASIRFEAVRIALFDQRYAQRRRRPRHAGNSNNAFWEPE